MNRKIQFGEVIDEKYISVGDRRIHVNNTVTRFIQEHSNKFSFARRPFVGSQRLKFKFQPETTHGLFDRAWNIDGYVTRTNGDGAWLCAYEAQKILGVGRKTKSFSLWFKPIA